MNILVAEDDRVSHAMLSSSHKEWGCEVVSAFSGKQACEVLENSDAPRLLLLDWVLPELQEMRPATPLGCSYPDEQIIGRI